MKTETIKKKKAMLEILEELFEQIERSEKALHYQYRKTDELEQQKLWNKEMHEYEPVYDENGSPVMENVWKDVLIPDSELSDRELAKIEAYKEIEKALEKLL